ncbi:hsp70 nucleotide exchange factor fes1 [Leucoagaricus gongylophorus]
MQSLLRWSIENSGPRQDSGAQPQKLDPGIIDTILGKSDAEQMKEDVDVGSDRSKSEDERVAALDHLEMLVEQIDNANDLEKLGLWPALISLLDSPESSTEIKVLVLWVIGTAIQNNPQAQDVVSVGTWTRGTGAEWRLPSIFRTILYRVLLDC